jgi:hypothetical protein
MAFDIVGGEPARGSDRLVNAPAHIGVDHQKKVGGEMIAHRSDPLEILRKSATGGQIAAGDGALIGRACTYPRGKLV